MPLFARTVGLGRTIQFLLKFVFDFQKEPAFIMIDNEADIIAKKELIEKRMNDRQIKRVTENK